MQVVCPKCKSRFNLPSGTKPGARLRCSVCMTVFSLPSEESSDYARQPSLSSGTLPPLGASDVPQSALPQLEEKKSHHPFLWFLVVVLVLGIAGYAAWELSGDFRGAVINLKNKFVPAPTPVKSVQQPEGSVSRDESSLNNPGQGMENAAKPAETNMSISGDAQVPTQEQNSNNIDLHSLRLEKVRQYFVDNEKVGRILVIEGQVVGQKPFLPSTVHVEAVIIGEDKKPLEKKEQKVGGNLSLLQLQKMDKEELENSQYSALDSNVKRQEFHFIVIFYNPVKTVSEFTIKISK
ncbi:MAG: hypothetical protein ACLTZ2_06325 [Desulfovibrio sp.]